MNLTASFVCHAEEATTVCLRSRCLHVRYCLTREEQLTGLMFQKYLPPDEGLLFVFNEEAKHAFWMKNVIMPLDIIWIDSAKRIVFINKNTQPCSGDVCPSIMPASKARYVLEVNAGTADAMGMATGVTLEF